MRTDLKGSIQYKDIFIRNGNAQGGIAHVLCIFLFYLYILIWFFFFLPFSIFFRSGLVSVFLYRGENRGTQNQYLKYLLFSLFFFCCVGMLFFGAVGGYNTLSGICLVFYSILTLKTSRVFGFPLHPLHDLWERLLFTYSFNSTTKTVRHRKHVDVSLFFKEKKK